MDNRGIVHTFWGIIYFLGLAVRITLLWKIENYNSIKMNIPPHDPKNI